MKKTLRKTMLSTICMLVVAIMSLTGVTYAWFSEANQASINQIEVGVTSNAGGVDVATTWGQWASEVDAPASTIPTALSPVSTVKALDNKGALTFYSAALDKTDTSGKKMTTTLATSGKEGAYIAFPIFFKNDGSADITLNLEGTSLSMTTADTNNIVWASRMAFVDFGSMEIEDNNEPTWTVPTNATSVVIYEPNAADHTQNGILDGATAGEKADYYGVKAAATIADRKATNDSENLELVETVTSLEDITYTVPAGSYHKIVVYVWVEGQDLDCKNDVAGENMFVDIKFNKVAA